MQPLPPSTRDLLISLHKSMPPGAMSAKKWTRWFQEAAANLVTQGRKHFGRCGRGEGWDPEYLVDATVSDNVPGAGAEDCFGYSRLLLAVETEWSTNRWNRAYDFCKLADIRAVRKLYACEVSNRAWRDVEERVVTPFSNFWAAHTLVLPGEEVGLMISSTDHLGAWVLCKGADFDRVV